MSDSPRVQLTSWLCSFHIDDRLKSVVVAAANGCAAAEFVASLYGVDAAKAEAIQESYNCGDPKDLMWQPGTYREHIERGASRGYVAPFIIHGF